MSDADDPRAPRSTKASADASHAYGAELAKSFGLTGAPAHVQRTVQRGVFAVSDIQLPAPMREPSVPLAYDDAFLVGVHLRSLKHEYWENGRALAPKPLLRGMTYLHDLKNDPRALTHDRAHAIHFYMPMTSLRAVAEHHDLPSVSDLRHVPLVGTDDPILRRLSLSARSALDSPLSTTNLLLDQILNAVCVHLIGQFGDAGVRLTHTPGGLAPWQERRAKELMNSQMDLTLADLARECGVSVSHFTRAFRQSTGYSPHQWLLAQRIGKAKSLIARTGLTLAEIALDCGFSSQSHLSAAFSFRLGVSPRQYRRSFAMAKGRAAPQRCPKPCC